MKPLDQPIHPATPDAYQALIQHMPLGFCRLEALVKQTSQSIEYRFLEVNPLFEQQTGLSSPLGKTIAQLQSPDGKLWGELCDQVRQTNQPVYRKAALTSLTQGGDYDLLAFPIRTAHHPQVGILCQPSSQPLPSQQPLAQESLREADQRLRLAIEAVQMATWEWHILTNQVFWNEQHFRLFGMTPQSGPLASEAFVTHIHPQDRPYVSDLLTKAVEQQRLFDVEFRIIRDDGVLRWMSGYGRVIEQQLGRSVRMSGVMFDITDRKVAQEALLQADQRKDEFLAMLAHELRNPLATVRNGLAILGLSGQADATRSQTVAASTVAASTVAASTVAASTVAASTVAMMNRQVDHLVRLVDDLLDVSRISQGKIELRWEELDLSVLVGSVIEAMRPQYEISHKELYLSAGPSALVLRGDATRLTQALTNLLTNGLRYTGEGGQVWVRLEAQDQQAVLAVADNGIGLEPDQLQTVFDLFVQGDNSLARSQGGLGVGLTLAKRLIELHGGRIEAQSPGLGKGSTFIVYLPLLEAVEGVTTAITSRDMPTPAQRVLVVDDNADAALTLSMLLTLKGYEVHSRPSGQAGIQAAAILEPTVILCDIGMPELDGYQTARLIRQQAWGQTVGLVAITGYGQAEDKQRAQEAGFDAHLIKPIDLDELVRLLTRYQVNSNER